jgi:hypothetical protein
MSKDTGQTVEEVELIEGGGSIPVTDDNKFIYVDAWY